MLVTIRKVFDDVAQGMPVEIETPYGCAKAMWHGRAAPQVGTQYEVELDVEEIVHWGRELTVAESESDLVIQNDEGTILQGRLESVDENLVGVLRIGGSIVNIEIDELRPVIGSFVRILCDSLHAYDVDW